MKKPSYLQTPKPGITRRSALTGLGAVAGLSALGKPLVNKESPTYSPYAISKVSDKAVREQIFSKVWNTELIDTHEHLIDESERLSLKPPLNKVNDWSILFSHYTDNDLISAGMPGKDMNLFLSDKLDPIDKWPLIKPFWNAVKNTGYGQATALTIRELYEIDDLNPTTVRELQFKFEQLLKPGLYKHVLEEKSKIKSCQVNSLTDIINETESPLFLMQDLRIDGFFSWLPIEDYSSRAGVNVQNIEDWYAVIDFFFKKYGKYAVGVKSSQAYARNIDYEQVSAEVAAPIFKQKLSGLELSQGDIKQMEDHLFWYSVNKCNEYRLPVKLHTGYYAGANNMPLFRVGGNAAAAADLCRSAPESQFVFFHICYPYYEDLLAVAKQYSNAIVDMCWAWIINPIAAKDFLKKYLMTVPLNKILTFGGDYIPVEPVLGHSIIARHGIAESLSELVAAGWLKLDDALVLTDAIMHGNAQYIFNLDEKEAYLKTHNF